MGIKRVITLKKVNKIFKESFIKIVPTKDGVSDTTYILEKADKRFILKIYEEADKKRVKNKLKLLKLLKNLPVTKEISKIEFYQKKPIIIYKYLKGKSPKKVNLKKIKAIAKLLATLHRKTLNKKSSNKKIYNHKNLKKMIRESNFKPFKRRYKIIKDIKIENHGIIHGDLFLDNIKFKKNSISGIFDFIEASNGDFRLDLGVVANEWAFKNKKLKKRYLTTLLQTYNRLSPIKISKKELIGYMLFSALFYSVNRYCYKYKNYKEYIKKFDYLKKMKL